MKRHSTSSPCGNLVDGLPHDCHTETIAKLAKLGPAENDKIMENLFELTMFCSILDEKIPDYAPHAKLKTFVKDRPGHDQRYAIDFSKIHGELDWTPTYSFEDGMAQTVDWYLSNREWCENVTSGKYQRERLGST